MLKNSHFTVLQYKNIHDGCEFLTVVSMKGSHWVVMLCSLEKADILEEHFTSIFFVGLKRKASRKPAEVEAC
jgi:hypothetical protein